MTGRPWSFARAVRAAAQIRTAPLGRQALSAIRPRSVLGVARSRAPLPLLLYLAGRDGLVTEQDNGGFGVLQPPAGAPAPARGIGLRVLRWLDRRWALVLFIGPPLVALAVAVTTSRAPAARGVPLVAAIGAGTWLVVFLAGTLAGQLGWFDSAADRDRWAASSPPRAHWSVPLVHQPDPERADELLHLLTDRLIGLFRTGHPKSADRQTQTMVLFTDGVSTEPTRAALSQSVGEIGRYPTVDDPPDETPTVYVVVRQTATAPRNWRRHTYYERTIGSGSSRARALILVAARVERDAVLDSVRDWVGRDATLNQRGTRTIYRMGVVADTELLLAQAGEQGTATAAAMFQTAQDAIAQAHPDYVILTGICFGLRPGDGQRLGDIVVARRVHNADHLKETDDRERPIYRGINVGVSPTLLDRFQAAQLTWAGAQVHIGDVITSHRLVDSEAAVKQLRDDFPDAIAGEMEAIGVHEAATLGIKPDWIMVKGISDWGHHKSDRAQLFAARNAAEYVTHVVAMGALRPRRFW